RVGYARVSIRSQDHQAQLDALHAAHCREIIIETASTRGDRPKLRETLDKFQAGDTLVIYKPTGLSAASPSPPSPGTSVPAAPPLPVSSCGRRRFMRPGPRWSSAAVGSRPLSSVAPWRSTPRA